MAGEVGAKDSAVVGFVVGGKAAADSKETRGRPPWPGKGDGHNHGDGGANAFNGASNGSREVVCEAADDEHTDGHFTTT